MFNDDFWQRVHSALKQETHPRLYESYLRAMTLENVQPTGTGQRLRIGVPGAMYKEWIVRNYLPSIEKVISREIPTPFDLEFVVTETLSGQTMASEAAPIPMAEAHVTVREEFKGPRLNPEYTFHNFVVGQSNEFAHAACFSVSEKPGKTVNPLFVCGPSGTGKTHLLNAVGIAVRERFPEMRICYISGERFINEVITSIRHKQMDKFHQRYRHSYDILIMDDIHVIARTQSTQLEFFETFNYFHGAGKQVVVASDILPREMDGLEDRIRTRLEWGLIVDIQPPDLETRVAILRYKAERQGIFLPDEVVRLIAQISRKSVRELEGNLNTIRMYSELRGVPITQELARDVFKSTLTQNSTGPGIEDVLKLVSDQWSVSVRDLKSGTRAKPIARPRQVAMYLARKVLGMNYQDIGRALGNRDHTTIMHGEAKIIGEMEINLDFKADVHKLESLIHNSQWNIL